MRSSVLAFAFLLCALPSKGELWTETGRALPGALGGPYRATLSFELARFSDLDGYARGNTDEPVEDEEGIVPSFRYYLTPVDDTEKPYRLQPFLQQASYVEGGWEMGPGDASLLALNGRYFFPVSPLAVTAELAFGKALLARSTDAPDPDDFFADEGDHFRIGGGAVYFLTGEKNLALEGSIALDSTVGEVMYDPPGGGKNPSGVDWEMKRTTVVVGARYVASILQTGGWLEVRGGLRMLRHEFDTDDSRSVPDGLGGDFTDIAVDARYFFDKHGFAGLKFTTDSRLFAITGGYATDKGFQVEAELGTEEELAGDFLRLKLGMRF